MSALHHPRKGMPPRILCAGLTNKFFSHLVYDDCSFLQLHVSRGQCSKSTHLYMSVLPHVAF
jgi:hypothetical protein